LLDVGAVLGYLMFVVVYAGQNRGLKVCLVLDSEVGMGFDRSKLTCKIDVEQRAFLVRSVGSSMCKSISLIREGSLQGRDLNV